MNAETELTSKQAIKVAIKVAKERLQSLKNVHQFLEEINNFFKKHPEKEFAGWANYGLEGAKESVKFALRELDEAL